MQSNSDMSNERPILDPYILNVEVEPDEDLKETLTEEEKQAEVVPEDFDSFNLDAVDKLKESKNEE